MDVEKITDPKELEEARRAWAFVKELSDAGVLLDDLDAEELAYVREVIERARGEAVAAARKED